MSTVFCITCNISSFNYHCISPRPGDKLINFQGELELIGENCQNLLKFLAIIIVASVIMS